MLSSLSGDTWVATLLCELKVTRDLTNTCKHTVFHLTCLYAETSHRLESTYLNIKKCLNEHLEATPESVVNLLD